MVKITITHENGTSYTYEDVVAFDFYDKEFCESVAEKKLSQLDLDNIQALLDKTQDITSESVEQTVKEYLESLDDETCIPF